MSKRAQSLHISHQEGFLHGFHRARPAASERAEMQSQCWRSGIRGSVLYVSELRAKVRRKVPRVYCVC